MAPNSGYCYKIQSLQNGNRSGNKNAKGLFWQLCAYAPPGKPQSCVVGYKDGLQKPFQVFWNRGGMAEEKLKKIKFYEYNYQSSLLQIHKSCLVSICCAYLYCKPLV